MTGEGSSRQVALTFDVDAFSVWIGSFKASSTSLVTRGEFDLVATTRVLEFLERHGITATFFVPGHTALAFPDLVRSIAKAGHEIGHHGYVHERPSELDADEERAVLVRGLDILQDVAGIVPTGYRSPSWEHTEHTGRLLVEHGFSYDSSLMGSDYEPYYVRSGDRFTPATPFEFGRPLPLVELPVSWILDDFPHFEYVRGVVPGLKPPSAVLEIWQEEFRFFHESLTSGCWTLTMHPQVIGRGHRMRMLEKLVQEMKSHDDVQFVTLGEAAREWAAEHPHAGTGGQ